MSNNRPLDLTVATQVGPTLVTVTGPNQAARVRADAADTQDDALANAARILAGARLSPEAIMAMIDRERVQAAAALPLAATNTETDDSSSARPLVADTRALTERALAARGLSAATSDANTDAQGESLLRHYRSQVLQAIRNRDENGAIAALDAIEDHVASIVERQQPK